MYWTGPKVFLIGETRIIRNGLTAFLREIGAGEWNSGALSDMEELIEVMGRICYKSFKPGLNPNVTRVREGNREYLHNVIKSRHGSVAEHGTLNFIFHNVSRVLTHELVRHRVGVAISQESLRYVRLNELGFRIPEAFLKHEKADEILAVVMDAVELVEHRISKLEQILDFSNLNFEEKKKLTSAMRRIAPMGLSTTIGWSVNIRELRHIIEMRTNRKAEEEIRIVFGKVAEIVKKRYPALFGDFKMQIADNHPEYFTDYSKV